MAAPFEYAGRGEICTGCVEVIRAGDMVGPISAERSQHQLCAACWWLRECDLPLPAWTRGGRGGGSAG